MKIKDYLCACGGYCDGICRKLHLHRERKTLDKCPAAYREEDNKRVKEYNDEG